MPWWGWIIVGAVVLSAELLVPTDFFLVFLGASALLVGLLGLLGWQGPGWAQWLVFAIAALISLVYLRRWLRSRLRPPTRVDDTLAGEITVAGEALAPGASGRVELRGTTWSARNVGGEPIAPGDRARVESVDRLTLLVRREP